MGDFSFSSAISTANGEIKFTKIDQGTGATFNNAKLFATSFEKTIQKFLTEDIFIGDWLPLTGPGALYTKTGGFKQKSAPQNYVYGTLEQ